jgi:hypothetical protein
MSKGYILQKSGPFRKALLPLAHLARVDFKPLRQFGHRLVAFQRFQRHPGFERWAVFPAARFQFPAPLSLLS